MTAGVCKVPGCQYDSQGRLLCVPHAKSLPPTMLKTLLFLQNHGQPRAGFDEALANAVKQIQDREREGPLDPLRGVAVPPKA